ncbi:unnamed protein product [Pleuronectes platessa]|uniref:Uncharacterized protein n=1 Tax=Pleuronectes platessa TaxID=8262 RepID=A0A9N7VXQ8_PLEPL|nr:unnamed protein product [Pleuronectes platessa]
MPPDTLGSISPGRIILVMQKSSGPRIAHSTELLLNLRSDPATCYLHPSTPDPPPHYCPCRRGFRSASTGDTGLRSEIHKPCVGAEKKMQHMLQALASPIAFQVIGQAQQAVGF